MIKKILTVGVLLAICGCSSKHEPMEPYIERPKAILQFDSLHVFNNVDGLKDRIEVETPLHVVAFADDIDAYRATYQRFQSLSQSFKLDSVFLHVIHPDKQEDKNIFVLYQVPTEVEFNLANTTLYHYRHIEGAALDVTNYRNFFHEAFRRNLSVENATLQKQLAAVTRFYGWNINYLVSDKSLEALDAWSVRRLESVFTTEAPTGYELALLVDEVLRGAGLTYRVGLDRRTHTIEVRDL